MDYYRAFPFYMGYQGYGQWAQQGYVPEDRLLEDLEYLQQMYPTYAKKYQRAISDAVDKVDYDGSFIYDQYPDKMTLQRMVASVMVVIKNNEENGNANMRNMQNPTTMQSPANMQGFNMQNNMPTDSNMPATNSMPIIGMPNQDGIGNTMMDNGPLGSNRANGEMPSSTSAVVSAEHAPWSEKEPWIRELVTVLMYYEILMRRRRKTKSWNVIPQNNIPRNNFPMQ